MALPICGKQSAFAPDHADYRFRLGSAYNDAGRYAEAVPELTQAARQLPRDAGLWEALGLALEKLKRFKEARGPYSHALEFDPNNTSIRNDYAYVLVNSGDPMGGVAQYKEILEREPNNVPVQVNIGYAYIGAGDYKEAIRQLSKVVRDHPEAGDGHYDLGIAYKQSDDLVNARVHLEQAVKLAPSLAEAHYVLAITYVDLGQTEKAVEQLRAAVEQRPDMPKPGSNSARFSKIEAISMAPSRRSAGPCRSTVQTRERSILWDSFCAARAIRSSRASLRQSRCAPSG